MKRTVCAFLAALIVFGGVWAPPTDADASTALLGEIEEIIDEGGGAGDTGDSSGSDEGDGGDSDTGDSGDTEKELIPLTAPSRIGWGRDYRFLLGYYRRQNPDAILTDELGVEYVNCPGMMYWSLDAENQGRYQIDLYKQDPEEGPVLVDTVNAWKAAGSGTMDSNFRFFGEVRLTGEYYFTVRALGDGIDHLDSELAQSVTWSYEAPETQLTRPTRPRWKNVSEASTAFIYPPTDEDNALGSLDSLYRTGYEARWWYAAALTKPSEDEIIDDSNGVSMIVKEEDDGETEEDPTKPKEAGTVLTFYPQHYEFKPSDKMIGEFGSGYYSVQVRALSGDVTKARPSDWSELSMARYVAGDDEDLETIVGRVNRNTDDLNRQLAINNVRKFGTYKLTELMAADVNNTGAAGAIQDLENITGNYAQIVVSGGLDELFPEQTIGVIGAGLNVDLGQTVVFHLGAAHADEVASTLYSHAVRFSMQLLDTNGASLTPNGTELKVPAKITLPVPDEINPNFFVILHHRMDGTVETLPLVSLRKTEEKRKIKTSVDGVETETEQTVEKWYASFILTNFSDFTMAEAAAIAEAKAVTGGVSLSYRFRTANVKRALCAVRGASGRVRAVVALEPSETRKTVKIPCEGDANSVKLFLLDANSAPVAAALTVPVTKS